MHKLKQQKNKVIGKTPDAYLYTEEKKDKKPTDKDLFIMTKTRDVKKKSK
jgi:hypothetical protein